MWETNRRVAIGGLSALLAVGLTFFGGVSYSSQSGSGGTRVAVQLSPYALAAWPLAILVVAASWRVRFEAESPPIRLPSSGIRTKRPGVRFPRATEPRWYRVLIALYIDFALYLVVVMVPVCLLVLWLESNAVGEFVWQFSREFARPTDALATAAFIPAFMLVWASLGIPMWGARESPGGVFAGIALVRPDTVPFWRCAVFGVFKYFALAVPLFKVFFNRAGGFQARAVSLAKTHAG